jgi:hypothetical protein
VLGSLRSGLVVHIIFEIGNTFNCLPFVVIKGAVTSPTLLPPGSCSLSRAVSTGLGHSVACRPDASRESSLSTTESDSTSYFNKTDDRSRQMVDPEAEAEAAASAVAVAAISSDESIGNGLGGIVMSVAENKGFGNSDVGAAPGGRQFLNLLC